MQGEFFHNEKDDCHNDNFQPKSVFNSIFFQFSVKSGEAYL